ncbi:MAG: M28 family metallopeptidase, partial [Bacteroidota bacterium]
MDSGRFERVLCASVFLFLFIGALGAKAQSHVVETYRSAADQLIEAALADANGWERLAYMVDTFGPRLSGSENLERSIDWALAELTADGFENVRGDEVMVPHWVRGEERLTMIAPRIADMRLLGLGRTVATPAEGIRAEALVVSSFEELEARSSEAEGRIVVFNAPFTNYGESVQYRVRGASEAAKHGAVAALIRSVTPFSMQTPHTGMMRYQDGIRQIPAAAITVEDALLLERFQRRGQEVVLELFMEGRTLPDARSRNVIAEIRGSARPDEVVVMGGHIDSWDVGTGAMDDAGGCVAAWQALVLMKQLGLQPRRTVRLVLWTNEENGLRGALDYRDRYLDELDRHVLAIESDAGVFRPTGFGFSGSDAAYELVRQVGSLLDGIDAGTIVRGGGGADIGPIMREGVPGMGLNVDPTRYFWYHHSEADTIDKLDRDDFNRSVAAMAVMAYVVADMEYALPR